MKPLVTIGIPTFNRPEMLARSLTSVARQDYDSIEVLVADNASAGDDTTHVVQSIGRAINDLTYTKHPCNIGACNNFFFLLREAKGKYFMWLADDDEISANYVSSLVSLLEAHADAVSAAGHWRLMLSETTAVATPTSSFPQRSALARAIRFIWRSDDAFFYGLHRTDLLRLASFPGYGWPNRSVLLNWAYVYLLDMVLRGRVLLAPEPSVQFINHVYTAKSYLRSRPAAVVAFMFVSRRLNVHYLYWRKCARVVHPLGLPILVVTSFLSLFREIGWFSMRRIAGAARRHAS